MPEEDPGYDRALQIRYNELYAQHRRAGDDVMNARARLESFSYATMKQSAEAAVAFGDDPAEGV